MKEAILFVLVGLALALAGFSAEATEYAPVEFLKATDVQLGQYPIEAHRLSPARQAELGLRPYVLPEDTLFFNHQKDGRFALKLMKKGTVILVDKDGVGRYEESCGNRIIDPRKLQGPAVEIPRTNMLLQAMEKPQTKAPEQSEMDSARAWVRGLPEPARMAAHGLSWIAASALLLLAAILAFWGLSVVFGKTRHNINDRGWHQPAPPPGQPI